MSNKLMAVEMAIFDSSGLTGSFAALNGSASYTVYTGNGFEEPIKMLKIYNGSDTTVTISYDGTTNNDIFPPGSHMILDIQTNHQSGSTGGAGTLNGAKGQILYGTGTAGTGNFYVVGYR